MLLLTDVMVEKVKKVKIVIFLEKNENNKSCQEVVFWERRHGERQKACKEVEIKIEDELVSFKHTAKWYSSKRGTRHKLRACEHVRDNGG